MNKFVLSFELIDSPLLTVSAIVAALSVILAIVWAPRRVVRTLIIAGAAGIVMFVVATILEVMGAFQGPLPAGAMSWGVLSLIHI